MWSFTKPGGVSEGSKKTNLYFGKVFLQWAMSWQKTRLFTGFFLHTPLKHWSSCCSEQKMDGKKIDLHPRVSGERLVMVISRNPGNIIESKYRKGATLWLHLPNIDDLAVCRPQSHDSQKPRHCASRKC